MWRGALHLHGGFGFGGTAEPDDISDELWRFRDEWEHVCSGGPPAARYPSLVVADDRILRFGGCGHSGSELTFLNDIWLFDGEWSAMEACGPYPEPRYTSAVAWANHRLFVFGGCAGVASQAMYGDLWRFERGVWKRLHGPEWGPGRRYGFGWTSNGSELFIFGGYDGMRDLNDFWSLDLETLEWRCIPTQIPPRFCPALGHVDGRVILFGGRSKVNPKKNFADTWMFEGHWEKLSGQSPGYHAKSGYASDGAAMWIYGGEGPRGHVSDLWRFTTNGWQLMSPARNDDPILW